MRRHTFFLGLLLFGLTNLEVASYSPWTPSPVLRTVERVARSSEPLSVLPNRPIKQMRKLFILWAPRFDDDAELCDTANGDLCYEQRYASRDWSRNIFTLPRSRILRRIASPLLFNTFVTFICCLATAIFGKPHIVSPLPHTLLGSALGLLLVFRTNAAYDRYWEARRQWSVMTVECRNFASLMCIFLPMRAAEPVLALLSAFPVVLKNYLRSERDTRNLKTVLSTAERGALDEIKNQPQYMLCRLRAHAHAARSSGLLKEKEMEMLLKSADQLGACVGACERIVSTPIPLHYSRHTSRFLTLYVSTLPVILVAALGWLTLPVMATICWALFGILEIGHLIEEPFAKQTDDDGRQLLPLNDVCRTIRRDVRELKKYADVSKRAVEAAEKKEAERLCMEKEKQEAEAKVAEEAKEQKERAEAPPINETAWTEATPEKAVREEATRKEVLGVRPRGKRP